MLRLVLPNTQCDWLPHPAMESIIFAYDKYSSVMTSDLCASGLRFRNVANNRTWTTETDELPKFAYWLDMSNKYSINDNASDVRHGTSSAMVAKSHISLSDGRYQAIFAHSTR